MNECPICLNDFDENNLLGWKECPHNVCLQCFIKSSVVYNFENQSVKIECSLCRTDINELNKNPHLITIDLYTKLFRTVRRKKCKICGEKNSPSPVVLNIDSCTIHADVCCDCGIKIECNPPNCFFLKCIVCKEKNMTPNFVGCFKCGTCPGHIQEQNSRTIDLNNTEHRKQVLFCSKCEKYKLACEVHWHLEKEICKC